jgi:hypothetical protein
MTKFKIIVGQSKFESARKYNGPRYVLPTRTFIKNGLIISLCFNHVSHREIREGGGELLPQEGIFHRKVWKPLLSLMYENMGTWRV